MAQTKKKNGVDAAPMMTSQKLGSLLKSARDVMRKDKGLNGDLWPAAGFVDGPLS